MKKINLNSIIALILFSSLTSCKDQNSSSKSKGELLISSSNTCTTEQYNSYSETFDYCYKSNEDYYATYEEVLECEDSIKDFTQKHGELNCSVVDDTGTGKITVGYDYLSLWYENIQDHHKDFDSDSSQSYCSSSLTYLVQDIINDGYVTYGHQLTQLKNRKAHIDCTITQENFGYDDDYNYILKQDLVLNPDVIDEIINKIIVKPY